MPWKILNQIKAFPLLLFRIAIFIMLPFIIPILFFLVNWENESDRKYAKDFILNIIKLKGFL